MQLLHYRSPSQVSSPPLSIQVPVGLPSQLLQQQQAMSSSGKTATPASSSPGSSMPAVHSSKVISSPNRASLIWKMISTATSMTTRLQAGITPPASSSMDSHSSTVSSLTPSRKPMAPSSKSPSTDSSPPQPTLVPAGKPSR